MGWQAICNSVGAGIGGFLGGALFLTLESEKFANQYIRPILGLEQRDRGIVTIKGKIFIIYKPYIGTPPP